MPGAVARLFDAMAGSYDELEPWYEHLYATLHGILRAELSRPGGGRGLDAGCGTGLQTAVLEALGYDTHGIDLSAGLLAVARSRLRTSTLTLGDVTALPYTDASFEAVTCCGSTLSFVETPGAALREFGRVLRPGGQLVLECEHKWSLDLGWAALSSLAGDVLGYGVSARDVCRQLARPLGQGFWLDYPVLVPGGVTVTMRIRLFTMGELRAMLRAAGFTPLRVWGIHSATNLIPSTILHRERLGWLAARLFGTLAAIDRAIGGLPPGRWFANSIVILARKDLVRVTG